jgi:hypothetical protein
MIEPEQSDGLPDGLPIGLQEQLLGTPEGAHLYAILDGAAVSDLRQAIDQHGVQSICLLRGELDPELAQAAPYLVSLDSEVAFLAWLLAEGWGKHWGIFASARADFRTLRQHLRSLLYVYGPENEPLFFRYYDPRVLRAFLPTCDQRELADLFGPVDRYMMEAEDDQRLLKCELNAGELVCR